MSKLTLNAEGMIVKAVVDATGVNEIQTMSLEAHRAYTNAIIKNIHRKVPVIDGVVLRARRNGAKIELYGQKFKTAGSNNPNAIALMAYAGDFDVKDNAQAVVQLSHWDEKNKELVHDYIVKCNDKSQDRVYYETNTHAMVVYGALDADLNKIMDNASDEAKAAEKARLVHDVQNMGLVMNADGTIEIADKAINGTHLTILNWSPSNMRNETQLVTPLKPDKAFEIMDEISGGALSQALQGELSIGALIKASARLGILGAPAIEMVESANDKFGYVIVMDEIQGPADYDNETQTALAKKGINIDTNTSDGAFCLSAEFLAATFAKFGKKLAVKKALLFAIQARATKYFTKVFGEAKTQKNMQYRLKRIIELYGEDKVLRVPAGTDVSKLNKDDYKVIIVGNEDCLGSIIDTNGGKLLKNIDLQTIVNGHVMTYLLDIAKCSETTASGQMLQKFLIANKRETMKVLLECMGRKFDADLEEKLSGEVNPHKSSLAQFMLRYAKNGKDNQAALEAVIKEEIKKQISLVYKLKIEIKAYFQRALFDDTFFLTNGKVNSLLTKNKYTGRLECHSRDIEVKFADEIKEIESNVELTREQKDAKLAVLLTGVAFKYPSPSSDENAIVTYVTSTQLKHRIIALAKAKVITPEERAILLDDFLNTSYGVTKLGADNTLKHKLAGMDTDYDGIAVVFEKGLVDILLAKYPNTDGLATIISE